MASADLPEAASGIGLAGARAGEVSKTVDEAPTIAVEVVWSAAPRALSTLVLRMPAGATIAGALRATGWTGLAAAAQGGEAFAASGLSTAVWGRARPLTHLLREGDRVEVLRGLVADPMDARRVRYEAAGGVKALRQRGYAGQKGQKEQKGQ